MGYISSGFIKLPTNIEIIQFARDVAKHLSESSDRVDKDLVRVQYAKGNLWLNIEYISFGGEKDSIIASGLSELKDFSEETIALLAYQTVDANYYLHRRNGKTLRYIGVCDNSPVESYGEEETWESQAREQNKEYCDETGLNWPIGFDVDMVINAFSLPNPWRGGFRQLNSHLLNQQGRVVTTETK